MGTCPEPSLSGKVAVVTGATSGIGRAVAVAMGAAGAKVVAVGRDLDRLDEVTTRLEGVGAEARAVRADLLDDAARHRVLDETTRVFGRLDVLVHSAAVFERRPFGTVGAESLDFHWATNTRVPFLLTEAALPRLEPGGSVLFLTSTVSRIGFADTAAYAMSKAAIDALTRVLAVECGPRGIRVNAISPGWIATPMNEETRRDPATTQTAIAATPLGRLGTPEDVAPAAVFLASDNARFITGATICVEAGYPALPVSPAAVRSTAFTMPS